MRYWLYSNGKMSGPFEAQELLLNPDFNPECMVCESSKSGGSPQDWQKASSVPELSEFAVLTSQSRDNFSFDNLGKSDDFIFLHPNILDTIDGAISDLDFLEETDEKEQEDIDSFDLRVTHMKEQLETAVWEKNLLLEKVRIKEERENEYKKKIKELEDRVDELVKSSIKRAYELSGLNEKKVESIQPTPVQDKVVEDVKDIVENKKNASKNVDTEIADEPVKSNEESNIAQNIDGRKEEVEHKVNKKTESAIEEPRTFKKLSLHSDNFSFGNERLIDSISSEKDDVEVFELKSFGSQNIEANPYTTFQNEKEEDSADIINISVPKKDEVKEEYSNLTIETPQVKTEDNKAKENVLDNNKIESLDVAVPQTQQREIPDSPAPSTPNILPEIKLNEIPVKKDENLNKNKVEPEKIELEQSVFSNISEIKIDISQASRTPVIDIPALNKMQEKKEDGDLAKSEVSLKPPKLSDPIVSAPNPADVTQRVDIKNFTKQTVVSNPRKTAYSPKKNRIKLYLSLAVSVLIILGGVIFLADFRKSSKKSNLMTASVSSSKDSSPKESIEGVKKDSTEKTPNSDIAASSAEIVNKEKEISAKDDAAFSSGQGVKNAIEAVKNFNLSNGRGTVANWFSNSFVSSGQSRQEWSATLLQGKIFVVQYRLIRPKQEPLVYQFEVNAETGQILRGINNNAIDLLESGSSKLVKKENNLNKKPLVLPKKKAQPKVYKPAPLPERDDSNYQEPSGFESSELISKAKIKITAPETDEELF